MSKGEVAVKVQIYPFIVREGGVHQILARLRVNSGYTISKGALPAKLYLSIFASGVRLR